MTEQQEAALQALGELQTTTGILLAYLVASDAEKSHEAISVMLMQGMEYFGAESPAMQQFFPVWDAIKTHIDNSDLQRAEGQARTWETQLLEMIEIVKNG